MLRGGHDVISCSMARGAAAAKLAVRNDRLGPLRGDGADASHRKRLMRLFGRKLLLLAMPSREAAGHA